MKAKQKIREMFCEHNWRILGFSKADGVPSVRKCYKCGKMQRAEWTAVRWNDITFDALDEMMEKHK